MYLPFVEVEAEMVEVVERAEVWVEVLGIQVEVVIDRVEVMVEVGIQV